MSGINLYDPTIAGDQLGVDRQRALAQMLLQKGNEDYQQQMAGGFVTPISPWQSLAKLTNLGVGTYEQNKADQGQKALNIRQSKMMMDMLNDGQSSTPSATPADAAVASDAINPPNTGNPAQDFTQNLQQAPQGQPQQSVPQDNATEIRRLRMINRIYPDDVYSKVKLEDLIKRTDTQKALDDYRTAPSEQRKLALAGFSDKGQKALDAGLIPHTPAWNRFMMTDISTDGHAITQDPESGSVYAPDGSTKIISDNATAIAQANASVKDRYEIPTLVNPKNGPPVLMTPTQQRAGANGGSDPAASTAPTQVNSQSMQIPPTVQAGRDSKAVGILKNELLTEKDPQNIAMINQQINKLTHGKGIGSPSIVNPTNAPAGTVGLPVQSEADKKFAETSSTNAANYEKTLNDTVDVGNKLMYRLNESEKALQTFKSGWGAGDRLNAARIAKTLGADDATINVINGGDIAGKQVFAKLAVQQAMEALKQDMNSGRITQAEFKIYQDNLPNLDTDPSAIKHLFDFARANQGRAINEQQAYQQFKQTGQPLDQWQSAWAKQQYEDTQKNKPQDLPITNTAPTTQVHQSLPQPTEQFRGKVLTNDNGQKVKLSRDGKSWVKAN